jgi:environmental stress-induced protein Ves
MEDFGWRISMAEVREGGPFSVFQNVDRQLAVLEGRLLLAIQDQSATELTSLSPILRFPGDVTVNASLPSGPVTDLNVMTRRDKYTAIVSRRSLISATALGTLGAEATIVIASGWIIVKTASTMHQALFSRDAAWLTEVEHETVTLEPPKESGVTYLLVRIVRLAGLSSD